MRFLSCSCFVGLVALSLGGRAAVLSMSDAGVVDTRRPIMQITAARQVDTRPLGLMFIVR